MLYPLEKQAYNLELLKKWRIYDVFHVSLLKQETTKKEQVDETTSWLEFENDNNEKKYKVKAICDSMIYIKESKGHLPSFYYLISWKGYQNEKNI